MSSKEVLRQVYKDLAPFSDAYQSDFVRFQKALDFLTSKVNVAGKSVLDLGSGIGIMALALQRLGAKAKGVDHFIFPTEKANFYTIQHFNEIQNLWNKNQLEIVKGDITQTPLTFTDGSVDIILCDATIEHLLHSPKALFQEAHRLLKPGGYFFVTTPNLANLLRRIRFVIGRSPHWDLKDFFNQENNFRGHRREYTVSEVSAMFSWSGFKIVKRGTKNTFFHPKQLLDIRKLPKLLAQLATLIAYVMPKSRDMVFVLGRKWTKS